MQSSRSSLRYVSSVPPFFPHASHQKGAEPTDIRSSIYQGQQIHISTWPAAWPTKRPSPGQPGGGLATANELRTSAHCFEAKAFGILSAGFLDTATRDELVSLIPSSADVLDACPRAPTCFVGPNGARLTSAGLEPGEKSERKEEQGMAYAIFDLKQTIEGKQYHDVVGSYGRPDIFELVVNRRREVPVVWKGENQRLGSQNELGAGKEEEGRAYV